MLKSKSLATLALAGMMTVGGVMAGGVSVHAADPGAVPDSGTTPVLYDNRNVLPDGNGQYGMIIPTAITFTDDKTTADASVEITGINGYDLDKDWTALEIKTTVQSANSYKLTGDGGSVDYTVKMQNNNAAFTADASAQEITKHFGIGAENVKKESGTATLTGKATKKGQYTDTLTYAFEEIKNSANNNN